MISFIKISFGSIIEIIIGCRYQDNYRLSLSHSPNIYLIVVTWTRVVCLICTPDARGPQARGQRVYISGKPRVPMLQLLCNTHVGLVIKIATDLLQSLLATYI